MWQKIKQKVKLKKLLDISTRAWCLTPTYPLISLYVSVNYDPSSNYSRIMRQKTFMVKDRG